MGINSTTRFARGLDLHPFRTARSSITSIAPSDNQVRMPIKMLVFDQ